MNDQPIRVCECKTYSPVIKGGECRICFGVKKEKTN